jgi:hypothetical protein
MSIMEQIARSPNVQRDIGKEDYNGTDCGKHPKNPRGTDEY